MTHTCEFNLIRADLGVIRISLKRFLSFVGDQKGSGQVPCIKVLLHIMSIYDGCTSEGGQLVMQVNLTPGERSRPWLLSLDTDKTITKWLDKWSKLLTKSMNFYDFLHNCINNEAPSFWACFFASLGSQPCQFVLCITNRPASDVDKWLKLVWLMMWISRQGLVSQVHWKLHLMNMMVHLNFDFSRSNLYNLYFMIILILNLTQ